MRTRIPRFLLGSAKDLQTFDAPANCVILPGFSNYDAAANYCQAETPGIWELQGLSCDRVRDRLEAACPQTLKLVAVDPADTGQLSLPALTLETVCRALRQGENSIDPEYRLMRDHWGDPWNHAKIAVAEPPGVERQKWHVACLHPQNMTFAGGQPLWFWLDWFDGKHVLSELQTERGGNTEREFFIFPSRHAAEGFYGATVARLLGCISHCEIDSHRGSEFEVTLWQKNHEVANRKLATVGGRRSL
jgi:hypothetical protein